MGPHGAYGPHSSYFALVALFGSVVEATYRERYPSKIETACLMTTSVHHMKKDYQLAALRRLIGS